MVALLAVIAAALLLLTFASFTCVGALQKLLEHHLRFSPDPPVQREALERGDILLIRAFGVEQAAEVLSVEEHVSGKRVVTTSPIGARVVGEGDTPAHVFA
jgi:hypothetical protein